MTEHQKIDYEVVAKEHPCPICGHTMFEWGIVSRFTPITYRRGFRFFRADPSHGVKARHCLTCDHIQLFADEELAGEQQRTAIYIYATTFIALVIVISIVLSLLG